MSAVSNIYLLVTMKTTTFIPSLKRGFSVQRSIMLFLVANLTLISQSSIYAQNKCHLDVEDPTVFCKDIHTAYMPDTCMVELWAKDFISKATDDYTPEDEIRISFDSQTFETSRIFFAEEGVEFDVTIYITDNCWKQVACTVKLFINDNSGCTGEICNGIDDDGDGEIDEGFPDTDGDGVKDCLEECPMDPNKTEPGVCDCGNPDIDSDGDGVLDCNDACPTDPLKIVPGICDCLNPEPGSTCDDGNPLTMNDMIGDDCICRGTQPPCVVDGDCDDGDPCTDDVCASGMCENIPKPDSDGDGICDELDICEGGDDNVDTDMDGVPDFCDICEGGDDDVDTDMDGVPDFCDICVGGVDSLDMDMDGVPDFCDICEGGDDTVDTDMDDVPDFCDICAGGVDSLDTDMDGVPDFCDICEGGDDDVDTDMDGVPDFCDVCDGGDDDVDSDMDGVPDFCDICEGGDDTVDTDMDGVPDFCDICIGGVDSLDMDGDDIPDFCDNCPLIFDRSNNCEFDEFYCVNDPLEWCGFSVFTCSGGGIVNDNEFVGAILDLTRVSEAPPGDLWSDPETMGVDPVNIIKPSTWIYPNLGQVFGLAVNPLNGDIFMGATDVYALDGDPFTPTGSGFAGAAGIYRANYAMPENVTALITTSANYIANPVGGSQLYNAGNILNSVEGNGIGNITIDPLSGRLFATNTEDGRMYSINSTTGIISDMHDPFETYVHSEGMVAPGELLWAITLNECTREIYFSRQVEPRNIFAGGSFRDKEIWKIAIDSSGNFVGDESLELTVTDGTRAKLTDIAFTSDCTRLMTAERGIVHNSWAYVYDLVGGNWVLNTNVQAGNTDNLQPWKRGRNVAGGVAFGGWDVVDTAGMVISTAPFECDSLLWITADCLDPFLVDDECNAYGMTGVHPSNMAVPEGGNINLFIDVTPENDLDPRFSKFGLGDVEIFNCCCPPSMQVSAFVAGDVHTANDVMLSQVEVSLSSDNMSANKMTDGLGHYVFGGIEMYNDYQIKPSKDYDDLTGISTLDVLMLQAHVLGLRKIDSPYNIIAGDINQSETISAQDIIELRKMILGIYNEWPNNKAWNFVDKSFEFDDADDPFPYSDEVMHMSIDKNQMATDFIAVKTGDVNGDYRGPYSSESRSRDLSTLSFSSKGGMVAVSAMDLEMISGFQLTIATELNSYQGVEIIPGAIDIDDNHYHISDHGITLSWSSIVSAPITKSEPLFYIKGLNAALEEISLSNEVLESEIYDGSLNTYDLEYFYEDRSGVQVVNAYPNPFANRSTISFYIEEGQDVEFIFFNQEGKVVHQLNQYFDGGMNAIQVDSDQLFNGSQSGLIYYKMVGDYGVDGGKLILIR